MEKTFEETKMFEIFVTNFDAKIGLYSSDVEIGPDFPYDAFRMVIKSVLRGAVSFVKEHETAMADTVAIHCVDEKNNFITAMVISEEADDEGKKSYELSFIMDEDEYDAQKDKSFDKVIEANEPAIMKYLANYLLKFSSDNHQAMKVADNNAGIMFVAMMAFFMAVNTYTNNVTEEEVKDDGLVVKFDDELIIDIKNEDGKRKVAVEPGTALKTFVKSDTSDQQA